MAITMMSWLLAIPLLGFVTGLRTMTAIAVVCWYAHLGRLPVQHTWAFWTANLISLVIFTVLAVGEYIGDKLPQTPNRTEPALLLGRMAFGGLVGAIAATGLHGSALEGILLGAVGALLGAFAGFRVRQRAVERHGCPDWAVAVSEDILAVALAIFAMGFITG